MAVASVSNLNPSQDPNLTYGTTPPATILTLLSHLQENCALPPDPSFLDVGCGNGEVTMAAAHHPTLEFKSCHGFDVEPERVEVANKMLTALAPKLPEIGGEREQCEQASNVAKKAALCEREWAVRAARNDRRERASALFFMIIYRRTTDSVRT